MIDRYDALVGLRSTPVADKRDFLIERFDKETFQAPKAEIISQLINDNSNAATLAMLKKALNDKDDDVRKAVVSNLTKLENDLKPEVEKLLNDPSYDLVAMTLEKLAFFNPDNVPMYLDKTKGVRGTRGSNVLVKWLEVAVANGRNDMLDSLVTLTSNSYEFITRTNAMNALKKLDKFSNVAMINMLDAASSPNGRLSGPAITVLKYFYEQAPYRKAMLDYYRSKTWKEFERDSLKQIFGE
jgi:hypothetical protein